ncbi:MAG: PSD1 and planctomycete cytochrome C domain-containing protein [Verrucomicrobiales bacterium]|nr:PSD1 and planctomycete cytochrome C domain-containing protein [Verrucomicrobiales bacterium]
MLVRVNIRKQGLLLGLLLSSGGWTGSAGAQEKEGLAFFKEKIEPVLIGQCYDCHSAISEKPKGGLLLDSRKHTLEGGKSGKAVVAGDVKASLIIEALRYGEFEMPPSDQLPAAVVADFEKWIASGAPDPRDEAPSAVEAEKLVWQQVAGERLKWWSLQAVKKVAAPAVDDSKAGWLHGAIDRFVLADLQKHHLQPSRRTDRRALLRRLAIVITGLIPAPEVMKQWLADTRADEVVAAEYADQLLASPQFGETWAQHWLDGIRFGESNGSEDNLYRARAWWYRDYVARAFNENIPYSQFVREQLAGDVLGVDEATGFLVAGPHVSPATIGREPTAILQARYDRLDELMQTVGASLLGSSLGCARCHDHKFDAISTKDYYSIVAVFQDVEYGHRLPKLRPEHAQMKAYRNLMDKVKQARASLMDKGQKSWVEDWGDHSRILFPAQQAKWVRVRFLTGHAAVDEVEIYEAETADRNLALASNGAKAKEFNTLHSTSNKGQEQLNDGEREAFWGWAGKRKDSKKQHGFVIELAEKAQVDRVDLSTNRAALTLTDYLIEKNTAGFSRFEIDLSMDEKSWTQVFSSETGKGDQNKACQELLRSLNELTQRIYQEGPKPIFAAKFIEPKVTQVLLRGDPNNLGEAVRPNGLSAFRTDLELTDQSKGQERRLAFANWLVDGKNPLTARVAVNRMWYHVFGAGIVTTLDDFGQAGEKPSHPQLLDYLAAEFVESNWDMKAMIRRMVLSQTFAQSSQPRAKAVQVDSGNIWLWRFAPRRVSAEVLRDSILFAAGTLDQRVGGKGYRIHADKKRYGQWKVVDNSSAKTWRRLFYQQRMRGVDDRMFMAFDLPDCKTLSSKRPVSTTPLQALNLMNGKLIEIQSEKISQRVCSEVGEADLGKQVDYLYQLILGRLPSAQEKGQVTALVQQDGLPSLARVLFNTNEFAFLN